MVVGHRISGIYDVFDSYRLFCQDGTGTSGGTAGSCSS